MQGCLEKYKPNTKVATRATCFGRSVICKAERGVDHNSWLRTITQQTGEVVQHTLQAQQARCAKFDFQNQMSKRTVMLRSTLCFAMLLSDPSMNEPILEL